MDRSPICFADDGGGGVRYQLESLVSPGFLRGFSLFFAGACG
ncbi:hypothetical protein BN1012_Phect401 [Candidatus Phaeomarinobacter ectocarpi]|uniref:Uncharacterized protein n=1 Tax=Candidatus Phaeomarinibacter ectocarpi TaxID=1458461 RepID=X5MKI9_9HYPH|nr:hypothetical protein BN1012_Phect401 [Candidatus Phaeomarinobacter ectocarpi]